MHPFAPIAATRHDELLADVARRRLLAENPDREVPAPWRVTVRRIAAAFRRRLPRASRNAAPVGEQSAMATCEQDLFTTAG
ncbi:hypothetical protein EXU48_05975 [Occultella glacieicola]|uniref:Uncharacterized protein n=1 Tax=Occultella glacieicola TaxID=2518684 RepID=A0ABY2E5D8_9MICO|nr:hypothetical protein [Occultella glacieicola]TDE95807.1 hypothetical protein EXU48_05975 [Occultella glacieicola]